MQRYSRVPIHGYIFAKSVQVTLQFPDARS